MLSLHDEGGPASVVSCVVNGVHVVEDWFSQQPDPDAARNYIFGAHPLGRIATPEEVGRAALFLATEIRHTATGSHRSKLRERLDLVVSLLVRFGPRAA